MSTPKGLVDLEKNRGLIYPRYDSYANVVITTHSTNMWSHKSDCFIISAPRTRPGRYLASLWHRYRASDATLLHSASGINISPFVLFHMQQLRPPSFFIEQPSVWLNTHACCVTPRNTNKRTNEHGRPPDTPPPPRG